MFIYSLRASTLKFFAVVCAALAVLIALIAFVPTYGETIDADAAESEIRYDRIKTNEDRIAFLRQFGWEVKEEAVAAVEVTIPDEFDKIFTGYNELQKRQGMDLSKYRKKEVMRYTYEITNYGDYEETVYANVLIYRNRVIGGDVCSADAKGFIHGFKK